MTKPQTPTKAVDYIDVKLIAREIRAILKRDKVPRASVRLSRFAGGTSIHIGIDRAVYDDRGADYWRGLCDHWAAGWFDGMTDSYNYHDRKVRLELTTDPVLEGLSNAKYVSVSIRH